MSKEVPAIAVAAPTASKRLVSAFTTSGASSAHRGNHIIQPFLRPVECWR
jgi:hypothetical protein